MPGRWARALNLGRKEQMRTQTGGMLFDVHAHLTAPELLPRLDALLASAHGVGVRDVVAVAEDSADTGAVLALPAEVQGVRIHKALGLHPEKVAAAADDHQEALNQMVELIRAQRGQVACVGEIGLDFRPHVLGTAEPEAGKETQRACMAAQVDLANELGLAVNVHSCSAGHHAVALLQERQCQRAVLHAFDGKAHYAEGAAAAGFFLSVPPCARRSPLMQKWIKRVPLDRLLLETDAPALAAEKGETNVPANLPVSCEVIAEVKGLAVAEVAAATRRNALALFGMAPEDG